jgi:hypothetical protein
MKKKPAINKSETYWIIDTEASGEHESSRSAYGPFESHEAAAAFLVMDAGTLLKTPTRMSAASTPTTGPRPCTSASWSPPCNRFRKYTSTST